MDRDTLLQCLRKVPSSYFYKGDRYETTFWRMLLGGKGGNRPRGEGGGKDFRAAGICAHTEKMASFILGVNKHARKFLPGWFTWTSIQVNHPRGTAMALHRHTPPVPWQSVLTFGAHSGGKPFVEAKGLLWGQGAPTTHGGVSGFALDGWPGAIYSGCALHGPLPWEGERWAVVLFTGVSIDLLTPVERAKLVGLGFRLRKDGAVV